LSGHHRLDGIVIMAGAGVKPGASLEGARIVDLTPTILHGMGLSLPHDLDGRVLSEAFEASSPIAQPVVYSQANVYKDGASSRGFSETEMEEVQDKLRGWGYAG
jgi:arylsulfatase A-like enzyme